MIFQLLRHATCEADTNNCLLCTSHQALQRRVERHARQAHRSSQDRNGYNSPPQRHSQRPITIPGLRVSSRTAKELQLSQSQLILLRNSRAAAAAKTASSTSSSASSKQRIEQLAQAKTRPPAESSAGWAAWAERVTAGMSSSQRKLFLYASLQDAKECRVSHVQYALCVYMLILIRSVSILPSMCRVCSGACVRTSSVCKHGRAY
jgi:hypothetical protein